MSDESSVIALSTLITHHSFSSIVFIELNLPAN